MRDFIIRSKYKTDYYFEDTTNTLTTTFTVIRCYMFSGQREEHLSECKIRFDTIQSFLQYAADKDYNLIYLTNNGKIVSHLSKVSGEGCVCVDDRYGISKPTSQPSPYYGWDLCLWYENG